MDAIGGAGDADARAPARGALAAHRPLRDPGAVPAAATATTGRLVLAMTHEEAVTFHVVAGGPLLPRPAADPLPPPDQGARRAASARGRAPHPRVHHEGLLQLRSRRGGARPTPTSCTSSAYERIFDRSGLRWYRVESDVGMMGGLGAHEYMAPCSAGENDVALSDAGYAANVEVATGEPPRALSSRPRCPRRSRSRPRTRGRSRRSRSSSGSSRRR